MVKTCKINGLYYPLLGDGSFIDRSLPHVPCGICKYAICAHCGDLFSLNHKCIYPLQYVRVDCICDLCDKKYSKEEIIEIFKNKNI